MAKIVLHIMDSSKYFQGVVSLLKKDVKGKSIVYVTTNKPYKFIVNTFRKKGVNPDKIFFIDCISKHIKENIEELANCVFIESPQNLTAISIAVNESLKNMKGKKVLFFDSLSVLLIYNDSNTVGKFSNFLLNKMRTLDVETIVLALESDAGKDVIKQIESFADEVKK